MKKIKEFLKQNLKTILVVLFILIFAGITYVEIKGSYLEYKELGEKYVTMYFKNMKYRGILFIANFVLIYILTWITTRGIKKDLRPFFESEKKEYPKLPTKSIALVISIVSSLILSNILLPKILLLQSETTFNISDPVFNLDIAYYIFIKPVIELLIKYYIWIVVVQIIYYILYHIIVFNMYFDGIDREQLKNSKIINKVLRNIILIAIGISLLNIVQSQNIVLEKFLTIDSENEVELIGAGFAETTIKLWGNIIFAIIITIATVLGVKNFKKGKTKKIVINILFIPGYLIGLFIFLNIFNIAFVKSNELDKEKKYIMKNIEFTKSAYSINVDEESIEYSGTITEQEVEENSNIIDNIPIINKDVVSKTLEDSRTETGYYTFPNISIANYQIDGKQQLVYMAPREIVNTNRSYNNKTYEHTHGYGEIITSASITTETGNVKYIQKELDGSDNIINITQPRIYFGLQNNQTIATSTKNKAEYDYTDKNGIDYDYTYTGKAGLSLKFWDKLVLALKEKNTKLAFTSSINENSKILINRNVLNRVEKVLPNIIYEDNPYTVIDNDGNIYWVIDGYTISDQYPYSTYSTIEYKDAKDKDSKKKINYIKNSLKVIVNAYDGTMKFYITDRNDPIIMAYWKLYPYLFEEEEIPDDIAEKLTYPELLYNVQAEMLKVYHNIKPDVLYRNTDIWNFATYSSKTNVRSNTEKLNSYYAMVNVEDKNTLGIVQMYTPSGKNNLSAYLIGTCIDGKNTLKIKRIMSESTILGPTQLDRQIEQDDTISAELDTLNVTGTKTTKYMMVIPVKNTLLYVEPIYQVMLNEDSTVPMLKKVIVASGTKVAIGNSLKESILNLLSKSAVDLEVTTTDDIESIIDAIIKTNQNLNESSESGNWELIGTDIQKLQTLIQSLEKLKKEQKKTTNSLTSTSNGNDITSNSSIESNSIK